MTWLNLFFLAFFWGSAFAAIRAGLEGYSPGQMAFFRFLVAALCLGIYGAFKGMRRLSLRHAPQTAAAGFMGITVYHAALNTGEKNVAAGPASLLLATLPLWAILWSVIFLKESPRFWTWLGMLLSFAGVCTISASQGESFHLNGSVLLVLLAAIAGSIFTVIQKQLLRFYTPVESNFYAILFGLLFLLPFSGGLTASFRSAGLQATLSVVFLGVFPGAFAFVLWSKVLAGMPASRAVGFLYLVPLFAMLTGWLWLGEPVHPQDAVGGSLILGGLILANTLGKG